VAVVVVFLVLEIYSLGEDLKKSRRDNLRQTENVGSIPEGDQLVLYWVDRVPIEMEGTDEYGIMLVNNGGEENPTPRYILGIAATKTLVDTQDLEIFKLALSKVPRGSTVYWYGTCTVPRYWGLSEEQIGGFRRTIKEAGLILSEEDRVTCYCEQYN